MAKKVYFSKIDFLKLVVLAGIIGGSVLYSHVFAQSPDNPVVIPSSQFQVCTISVDQPACYAAASPTPVLNWTFTSSNGASTQQAYWVQIDDNGGDAGIYPSPEVNTGEIISSSNSYTVSPSVLQFGVNYAWKVAVRDNFGTWSGWTCAETKFTTNGPCGGFPTVISPSVSTGSSATYCTTAAHYFSWTYFDPAGKLEDQFHFQVDNNSDFSSPAINRSYYNLNNPSPTVNSQTVVVAESPGADQIGYNTAYYWRVAVVNKQGTSSGWINGNPFTTESHRYPSIDFNWSPQNPSVSEEVLFADQSTVYGGATKSAWLWTFQNGVPASSIQQNPIVKFISTGSKTVTLQVTDSSGFACSNTGSKIVNVGFSLPDWREILPF